MKLSRRGLLGWLGALTGAAAGFFAPRVVKAQAYNHLAAIGVHEMKPYRPVKATGTLADFKREFGIKRFSREHGVTLAAGEQAFALNPALEVSFGTCSYRSECDAERPCVECQYKAFERARAESARQAYERDIADRALENRRRG